MAENEIPKEIAEMSFEDALQALEEIVKGTRYPSSIESLWK